MGKKRSAKKGRDKRIADLLRRVVDLLVAEGQPLEISVQPLALKQPLLERQDGTEVLKVPVDRERTLIVTAREGFKAVGLQDIQALVRAFRDQRDLTWILDRVGYLIRVLYGVTQPDTLLRLLHQELTALLDLELVHTFDLLDHRVIRFRRVDVKNPEIQKIFRTFVGYRTDLAYAELAALSDHPLAKSLHRVKPQFLTAVEFMDFLPQFDDEELREKLRPHLEGLQAFVLPLKDVRGPVGIMFGARTRPFTRRERKLLEYLVPVLGRLWRNAQVAEETRVLRDLLARLQHFLAQALQRPSKERLLEEAFALLQDFTGAFKVACYLREGETYHLAAHRGLSREFTLRFAEARPGDTPVLLAAETRELAVVQHVPREVAELSPEDRNEGYYSLVSVPIFEQGELEGVLTLLFAKPWQGTPLVQQILKITAQFLSIALRRAELEELNQRQLAVLKRFTEVLQRLTFPFPPDELVENFVSVLLEIPLYHHVGVWDVDPLRKELRIKTFRGIPLQVNRFTWPMDRGLLGKAARTGETVWVNDTTKDTDFVTLLPKEWFPYSEICVPLKDFRGEVFGILQVQSRLRRAFTPHDVYFLEAMAAIFSLLYQSFEMHQRMVRRLQFHDAVYRFLKQSQVLDVGRVEMEIQKTLEEVVPGEIQGFLLFRDPLRLECRYWPADPSREKTVVDYQVIHPQFLEWLHRGPLVELPADLRLLSVSQNLRLPLPEACKHRYLYILRTGPNPVAVYLLCTSVPLGAAVRVQLQELAPLAARILYNAQRYEEEAESRRAQETILEFAPDWILSVDPEGTILYSNYRAFQALGKPPESLVGKKLQEVFPLWPVENYLKTLQDHGVLPPTEVALQESPNEEPYAHWNLAGSRTPTGQYVLILRDVSALGRPGLEPVAFLSSAVAELAAGVAHEINNPLTGVLGIVDYWLSRGELPDSLKKDLQQVKNLAAHASFIARDLLTLATDKRRVKPEPFDLDRAVDQVLEIFDRQLTMVGVEVERKKRAHRPIYLWGYEGEIQQVVVNLLLNARDAIRYSRKGDRVEVITDVEPGVEGDYAVLIVRDNGPGIPQDQLPRIFAPFFTTKPPGKGTGLGLTLVARIVREHKGTIEVDSQEGKGTTFTIRLPLSPEARVPREEERRPRILVGEFEPFLSRSIIPALQKWGFDVEVATDGATLMEYISSRVYDLALVNTGLPGFSLEAFYSWLKRRRPDMASRLALVVDEVPPKELLKELDANDVVFLLKPVSLTLMVGTVLSYFYVYLLDKRAKAAAERRKRQKSQQKAASADSSSEQKTSQESTESSEDQEDR